MAFVVEDGSGVSGANSFVEVDYADEYFTDRGNTVWLGLSIEQKQAALVLASDYASTQYRYKGQKADLEQGLAFPRVELIDPKGMVVTGVPSCILRVVTELAIRAATLENGLVPDPEFDGNGRSIKEITEALGPLKRSVKYAGPGELIEDARFPAVDAMMCPWLLMADNTLAHGAKVAGAVVSGVSRSEMRRVHDDLDRYTGPLNENDEDVGHIDGDKAL